MNYNNASGGFGSKCFVQRVGFLNVSYLIINKSSESLCRISPWQKLRTSPHLRGHVIETLNADTIYRVENIFNNKKYPRGFYDSHWSPIAIENEDYFENIPLDSTSWKKHSSKMAEMLQSIDYLRLSRKNRFCNRLRAQERLRSVLLLQSNHLFLVFDYPYNCSCKNTIVVRDKNWRKVLHVIRDANRSYFGPLPIHFSNRIDHDFVPVVLSLAIGALDRIRPELNN